MEKIPAFILMLIILVSSLISSLIPGAPLGYEVYSDLAYADGANNTVDIYLPNSAYDRAENGCILFIHGGSWSGGDKSEEIPRCMAYAAQGYVTATMNYTLYTSDNEGALTAFDILDEIGMALAYVRDFLRERGIALTAAATSGYSAGAHLSMLYAYTRADESPVPLLFTANQVGPSDFDTDIWGDSGIRLAAKLNATEISEEMILNGEADALIAAVSPAYHVSASSVPSLLAYGGRDTLVKPENGASLLSRLESAGAVYDYVLFENSDHALLSDPLDFIAYYVTLREYCNTYFGY